MMKWQRERGRFKSDGGGTFEFHAIKTLPRAGLQGLPGAAGVAATPHRSPQSPLVAL